MADLGKLNIVLVTPFGEKLAGTCHEVVLPGALGQFGVLPGHIDFFAQLKPGLLSVSRETGVEYYAVGKGFVEVGADHVTIVAQSAEAAAEIDPERAKRALARAAEALARLSGNTEDTAYIDATLRAARAQARLDAAEKAAAK